MSPRSQPVVSKIVGQDCSPKVATLMTGCWRRDIDGVVCCLRWVKASWWDLSTVLGFPFILVTINQSHLSLLPKSYSANPHVDPKTHFGTGTIVLFLCHDSHNPPCLPTYVLCLALFFVMITSYRTFILQLWWFCLLSAPLWFRCLHTPCCYLFLANWSVRRPALNF